MSDTPQTAGHESAGLGIFINYRHVDSTPGYAGRVRDRLKGEFPQAQVFFDVETMPDFIGLDWEQIIDESLQQCSVFLALIGERWLEITRERADEAEDWVRREIAVALQRGIRIVPLLVERARMPGRADLPTDITQLAKYQGLDISGVNFEPNIARIVAMITRMRRTAGGGAAGGTTGGAGTTADETHAAEAAAARDAEEKAKRNAEAEAAREAQEKAQREAQEKAQREAQEKAQREAQEKAQREAEAKARRAAAAKARREAAKAKREAEAAAAREAEAAAAREAEAAAAREAEAAAAREAEAAAAREAEAAAAREAEAAAAREAEEEERRRNAVAPPPSGRPSLTEILDQTGLRTEYRAVGDDVGVILEGRHVPTLVVALQDVSDDIVLISTPTPDPVGLGEEEWLRNLLCLSMQANYVKAMARGADVRFACEVPRDMLTPRVAEGLVRGLSALGDATPGQLGEGDGWRELVRTCNLIQAPYFDLDPEALRAEISRQAQAEGIDVQPAPGGDVNLMRPLPGRDSDVCVHTSARVCRFAAVFAGVRPSGNRIVFLRRMLELSGSVDVARMAIGPDGDVAFVYEVPAVGPALLGHLRREFRTLLGGGIC